MKDVNIEFCHIYADSLDDVDFSHLRPGLVATKEVIETLENAGKSYSLNILIDNYFVKNKSYDFNRLMGFLSSEGFSPDGVYLEADLHSVCEIFISMLKPVSILRQPLEIIFKAGGLDTHLFGPSSGDTLKGAFLSGIKSLPDEETQELSSFRNRDRCQHSSRTVIVQYREDEVRYSCPLLATCWVMARFGVQPFMDSLSSFESKEQKTSQKRPKTTLYILGAF